MRTGRFQTLLAEFVGTFVLVFAGTGAVATGHLLGNPPVLLTVAFAFGGAIAVMVYTYRSVSGAHFNPAVTFALWIDRRVTAGSAVAYIATQLAAAAAASGILALAVGPALAPVGATLPADGPGMALLFEVIATFVLVTVILGVVRVGAGADAYAGLAIGGTVFLCALFAGPVSGASMNPARSFGPALFAPNAIASYWIYVAGPLSGAFLAWAAHRMMPGDTGNKSKGRVNHEG